MTARSQRRAAEMAVIEAARAMVTVGAHTNELMALGDAVSALDALGLADPGRARANKGAPVTAQQAAIWMNSGIARSVCSRIIRLLNRQDGLTAEEIMGILGGKHQTTSARVSELRDSGWIVDSGIRRMTTSGRDAVVWVLSRAARAAIAGQGTL